MSLVQSLLNEMRGRLGMYLGVSSVIRLAAFLRGYDLALEKIGGTRDPFMSGFRDWIHERFGSCQHSWEETILSHSANEAEAVKRFWELLDEFVNERGPSFAEELDTNGMGRAAKTMNQETTSGAKQQ